MPPSRSLTCWKPFAESVTVLPSPSTTQPAGSGLWLSLYTRTFPAATVVVAMSSSNGALRFAGAANASGFVPMTGSAPNVGTMVTPRVAEVTMPITPRWAAMRA